MTRHQLVAYVVFFISLMLTRCWSWSGSRA